MKDLELLIKEVVDTLYLERTNLYEALDKAQENEQNLSSHGAFPYLYNEDEKPSRMISKALKIVNKAITEVHEDIEVYEIRNGSEQSLFSTVAVDGYEYKILTFLA